MKVDNIGSKDPLDVRVDDISSKDGPDIRADVRLSDGPADGLDVSSKDSLDV